MKSLALLVSLFASTVITQAATITGGTLTLPGFGGGEFHLTGPGLELHGLLQLDDVVWNCRICGPDDPILLTPQLGSSDVAYNGTPLDGILFQLTYPQFTHGGQSTITVPFSISAQVVLDHSSPGGIIPVSGWGHMVFNLSLADPSLGYPPGTASIENGVLNFEPVPEPATALLLIPGLAFLIARKRFS